MSNTVNWKDLVLPHILNLQAYSSARDEFSGDAKVFLDANENPFDEEQQNWNRYPDPLQMGIKQQLSKIKGIASENIFLGNGSDEAIDLLFRIFCKGGDSNVITCPPTYGMYKVSSSIHNVANIEVPLTKDFQLDVAAILKATNEKSKMLFICSPNNPTGNSLRKDDIETLLENFRGIVIIDEAYIDFSAQESFIHKLKSYPNLVVLQTLSKAWGMASARLGMAFANPELINILNKVKPPYNISGPSQKLVEKSLRQSDVFLRQIKGILAERDSLNQQLQDIPGVKKVFDTDANFILVKIDEAKTIYKKLINKGIVVRDRSNVKLCYDCLRITVGTSTENKTLISALRDISI
ncbi:histidinol-phosphate aminotransferase [Marivirga tractuosa]|uniref:Histidinol-phosphate aminotransferase n=1 Tax=Marivirga tractuosa (strain ATCC 23168 / DSM 4126 / NBRC 15989 / NCIMB 1408 / VKM B-1430 / H-43) TaxID=643867 RepID=E4TVF9_MARTH|nr:histidinol-phosphate transaminase [Marivirga tractuosa]ADR20091.1 histidinol phosphate aminotransferase apoenzyme [Marivirga tractuosa DSM 4126]BDD15472.1 histidinol-phosphate aminotransferase [Marivirga tractuosa]